jgi:hypothetical protein
MFAESLAVLAQRNVEKGSKIRDIELEFSIPSYTVSFRAARGGRTVFPLAG